MDEGVVCEDCVEGDHRSCLEQGGYLHEDTDERCACHLSRHWQYHWHRIWTVIPGQTRTRR